MVNVNLGFSAAQAPLAAEAGATLVSPFIRRLDDLGQTGMELIADIVQIFRNDAFKTEVPVASVRHSVHVVQATTLGTDIATVPPAVSRQLFNHPRTEKELATFLADWVKTWSKTGQHIA